MNWLKNKQTATNRSEEGFTLIELMIVVVIIGILAAIAIPIFANQQKAANEAVQKQDLKRIQTAIILAQANTSKTLYQVTNDRHHAGECFGASDFAVLPQTHSCWVAYNTVLDKISVASKVDIRGMVDPYKRPYIINPNEGEGSPTDCRKDVIGYWGDVYTGTIPAASKSLPMISSFCS